MKWRRDNTYVGLRDRTEPNHVKGSAQLYGTGAEIVPLDADHRVNFKPTPPTDARYTITAWVKWGHLTQEKQFRDYAVSVEEGKRRCDEWLAQNTTTDKDASHTKDD
jgi:hypothetical protein